MKRYNPLLEKIALTNIGDAMGIVWTLHGLQTYGHLSSQAACYLDIWNRLESFSYTYEPVSIGSDFIKSMAAIDEASLNLHQTSYSMNSPFWNVKEYIIKAEDIVANAPPLKSVVFVDTEEVISRPDKVSSNAPANHVHLSGFYLMAIVLAYMI
jgi:hypothetical protein